MGEAFHMRDVRETAVDARARAIIIDAERFQTL